MTAVHRAIRGRKRRPTAPDGPAPDGVPPGGRTGPGSSTACGLTEADDEDGDDGDSGEDGDDGDDGDDDMRGSDSFECALTNN
ncbi:hypothetical protein [Streptomyces ambofaciens]